MSESLAEKWLAERGLRIKAESRITELSQQLEDAKKDAERYRWLASHEQWHVEYGQFNDSPRWFRMVENGDSWGQKHSSYDVAIDSAIAASKPAGGE